MKPLNKNDIHQIKLIEKKLNLYQTNQIGLYELTNDLTGIINNLESLEIPWKNDLRKEINTLEMIHDSKTDGSIEKWQGDFHKDLQDSLDILQTNIKLALNDYLNFPDSTILDTALIIENTWLMCSVCNHAWKSTFTNAMLICPKCDSILHNPNSHHRE